MTATLPLHVAAVDEVIPPQSKRPFEPPIPDMRKITPLPVMLAELAHLHPDLDAYLDAFTEFYTETGCSLTAHYDRNGVLGLSSGYPCDGQERHRNRWMHYLIRDLRKVDGAEDALIRRLIARRLCWDERPADPRDTTTAVRDWLRAGGRILLNPEGRVAEGGDVPAALINGTDEEAAECKRAGRVYFAIRHRRWAFGYIRRAVRMLGIPTDNGWIVLEARS